MKSIIVLLFATTCACAVSASVITINVFGEDAEVLTNKISHSNNNCKECNEMCQGEGFVTGVCVNSECNCRGKVQIGYNNKDVMKNDEGSLTCDTRGCQIFCTTTGHNGGYCLGASCVCY